MKPIIGCCLVSATLFAFPMASPAEDVRDGTQPLGKAPGPVYETAEQIRKMSATKATVVQRAPCFVYLTTADEKGFYIGSPGSTVEVVHFLEMLQDGKTYRFPDEFLDYEKTMVREIAGPVVGVGWPKGIAHLANHESRFYGTEFIPCLESSLFYSGDAAIFNRFLKSASELPGTQLIVHPGSKQVAPKTAPEFLKSVDWELYVDRAPTSLTRGADDFNSQLGAPATTVSVHLWLGGRAKWDEVEIPSNIRVESSGELEDFIRRHNRQLGAE